MAQPLAFPGRVLGWYPGGMSFGSPEHPGRAQDAKNEHLEDRGPLLMLVPKNGASAEPVIDEVTRKMAAALRNHSRNGRVSRGLHVCRCGAFSDNSEHWIKDDKGGEYLSNSLAVHYVAYHRDEVPKEELQKIAELPGGGEEPNKRELLGLGK